MTFWPDLIRAVNQTEGSIGIAFNLYTIFVLWRRKMALNARTYRISITISSVHAALMSLIVPIFASAAHLFHFDSYIIVMYGAAASSPWCLQQLAVFYCFFCAYTIWEMVPAASILQYLALTRPHISMSFRLLLAYGICLMTMGWTIRYCLFFYQSPAFDEIVISVHNLTRGENFLAFGGMFFGTGERPNSVLRLALEGILPTYLVSYLIFGYCIIRIRHFLNFGTRLSKKTLRMQRKFLIMMILQTLLPLLIFALPITMFIYSMLVGTSMDLITLAISFSVWSIPSMQALVHLTFVINRDGAKEQVQTITLQ